ncbi:hypothetical protein AV530_007923 [Patagioenas fasciata monilis]|uniref:Uncharacterized protein n=1 Tax=Patagioenas fasciata monilis TaxID=372326 RepID=A0A1V4JGQ6_PATFA|nr:hypothetical protein AV530_007923 [Patagioenas fasciata monilis]
MERMRDLGRMREGLQRGAIITCKDELIPQPYLSFLINYLCGVFAFVRSLAVEGLFDWICNEGTAFLALPLEDRVLEPRARWRRVSPETGARSHLQGRDLINFPVIRQHVDNGED